MHWEAGYSADREAVSNGWEVEKSVQSQRFVLVGLWEGLLTLGDPAEGALMYKQTDE